MSASPGGRAGSLGISDEQLFDRQDWQRIHCAGQRKEHLEVASRRMAAKLVHDAAALLDQVPPRDRRSPVRDPSIVPDPSKLP
jgi:hypothetical protein